MAKTPNSHKLVWFLPLHPGILLNQNIQNELVNALQCVSLSLFKKISEWINICAGNYGLNMCFTARLSFSKVDIGT